MGPFSDSKREKPLPPERIFGWLNSQLSVARFAGGCKFNGADYVIAYDEEGQPLVRADVLKRERPEKAKRAQAERKAAKAAQGEL